MQVVGDAARLRQVLLNLAGNAIKFTSSGGVALIVEPGIWPNEISFSVRDTGIGIAPEAQSRIFREFEQADDAIARSYGGTGLGLSISERIVKRMGGRITLQSQPGTGSTFEVSLPLAGADDHDSEKKGVRRTRPDRSIDHAGGAADHRGVTGGAAAGTVGGGQTCMVSDIAVAQALLPERSWHAVLLDRAFGAEDVAALAEFARGQCNPAHRHVHDGDAARTAAVHGDDRVHRLLGLKPFARGVAGGAADDDAGNRRAESRRRCPDRGHRSRRDTRYRPGTRPFDPGRRRQVRSTRC